MEDREPKMVAAIGDERSTATPAYQPDQGSPRPELWPALMLLPPEWAVKPYLRTLSLTGGPRDSVFPGVDRIPITGPGKRKSLYRL